MNKNGYKRWFWRRIEYWVSIASRQQPYGTPVTFEVLDNTPIGATNAATKTSAVEEAE